MCHKIVLCVSRSCAKIYNLETEKRAVQRHGRGNHNVIIPVVNIPIIIIIVTTIDINRRESTVQEILLLLYRYQPIIFSCDAQRNDTSYITGKFVHSKRCIMYVQAVTQPRLSEMFVTLLIFGDSVVLLTYR